MKGGKEILITFLQPRKSKSTLHYEFFQVRLKPVSNEIFKDLFQIEFFFTAQFRFGTILKNILKTFNRKIYILYN
jgi:hypothetical protein